MQMAFDEKNLEVDCVRDGNFLTKVFFFIFFSRFSLFVRLPKKGRKKESSFSLSFSPSTLPTRNDGGGILKPMALDVPRQGIQDRDGKESERERETQREQRQGHVRCRR